MSFLKTAETQIMARAIDIANIEYAPESLKIFNKSYGEELVRRMAEIMPLKTDPSNYIYVRNHAISSLEHFGYNQNRDAWLYDTLRSDYHTFIGSPVCCNHDNSDPNKYYGLIPDSAFITSKFAKKDWEDDYEWQTKYFSPHAKYGEKSGWVENILAINKALIELDHPGLLERIENGDVAGTSMGCICQYSICSICGNKASTPAQYCIHVAHLRNYGLAESENLFELNFDNTFFEDSIIIANTHADRNAVILNKYAHRIPLYNSFKQSIRNEFLPYIKVADNLILDKKEDIQKYCECLVGKEKECEEKAEKEATEKHVNGRYRPRGGMDLGTTGLDITRALTRMKNPATIGKQYVQNQRKPTYNPTNPQNFIEMPPYDVPPRLSVTLKSLGEENSLSDYKKVSNIILAALEKAGLGEATVDVMTGLMGPVNLNQPPDSYLKNLEGADKDYPEHEVPKDDEEHEKEETEGRTVEEDTFEPPIKWVNDEEEMGQELQPQSDLMPSTPPIPMGAPSPAPTPAPAMGGPALAPPMQQIPPNIR